MRITCLIDGFNIYHSLIDAIDDGAPASIKWLNLRSLCEAHLSAFNDKEARITELFYFTSLANYRMDGAVSRHRTYIKAIESRDCQTIYGKFKDKEVRCEAVCRKKYIAHVEKQTDVNIALKIFELFHLDRCDACLIMTGDGDLLSAIKIAKHLFPEKLIAIAFPYKRWNPELSI